MLYFLGFFYQEAEKERQICQSETSFCSYFLQLLVVYNRHVVKRVFLAKIRKTEFLPNDILFTKQTYFLLRIWSRFKSCICASVHLVYSMIMCSKYAYLCKIQFLMLIIVKIKFHFKWKIVLTTYQHASKQNQANQSTIIIGQLQKC